MNTFFSKSFVNDAIIETTYLRELVKYSCYFLKIFPLTFCLF